MARRHSPFPSVKLEVLAAIREAPEGEAYGLGISRRCALPSGSVYRALLSLLAQREVESRNESLEIAQREGRPPRVLYRLTDEGRHSLTEWKAVALNESPIARSVH